MHPATTIPYHGDNSTVFSALLLLPLLRLENEREEDPAQLLVSVLP